MNNPYILKLILSYIKSPKHIIMLSTINKFIRNNIKKIHIEFKYNSCFDDNFINYYTYFSLIKQYPNWKFNVLMNNFNYDDKDEIYFIIDEILKSNNVLSLKIKANTSGNIQDLLYIDEIKKKLKLYNKNIPIITKLNVYDYTDIETNNNEPIYSIFIIVN